METIKKEDVPECYQKMLATGQHHNHEIVLINGLYRWKEDQYITSIVDSIGLNKIVSDMYSKGLTKNSEEYRKLYRDIGYSLNGYWEVFYWEMNNEEAYQYKPPADW